MRRPLSRPWMGPAPPGHRIGREAPVSRPEIPFVVFQTEVLGDFLGITYALENGHVLAAGKHEGIINLRVDLHHPGHDIIIIGELVGPSGLDIQEISPNQGRILDHRRREGGHFFFMQYGKVLIQVLVY